MTSHASHSHPATPAARAACRKLAAATPAHPIIEVKLSDADWQRAEWIGEATTDGVLNGRLVIRTTRTGFVTSVHPAATRPMIGE